MLSLWATIKGWVFKIGAVVVAIGAALLYGLSRGARAGRAEVEAKDAKATVDAVQKANTVKQDVAAQKDGKAASDLQRDWNRE